MKISFVHIHNHDLKLKNKMQFLVDNSRHTMLIFFS